METYHKIKTVLSRDPDNNYKTLLDNVWAKSEFEYLQDNGWVFTEKIDGTNVRIHWDGQQVEYSGRTDRAQMPTKLIQVLMNTVAAEQIGDVFEDSTDVTLYGEGFGAGIQKGGGNYRPDQGFILFDVLICGMWLERENVEAIASSLGVSVVAEVGTGSLRDAIEIAQHGFNSTFGDFPAEGLVMRPRIELTNRRGERVIGKIKTKDFADAQ